MATFISSQHNGVAETAEKSAIRSSITPLEETTLTQFYCSSITNLSNQALILGHRDEYFVTTSIHIFVLTLMVDEEVKFGRRTVGMQETEL